MNADLALGDRRTRAQANRLGLHVSMPLGCYHPRTSSPFTIILANKVFFSTWNIFSGGRDYCYGRIWHYLGGTDRCRVAVMAPALHGERWRASR